MATLLTKTKKSNQHFNTYLRYLVISSLLGVTLLGK